MRSRRLSSTGSCGNCISIGGTLCLAIGLAYGATSALALDMQPARSRGNAASSMSSGDMSHMAGHMRFTSPRPMQAGDQQKADAVVAAASRAMEPYRDYRKALASGYRIFLPNVPQAVYHFSRRDYAIAARWQFNPAYPTSLLYTKTRDGGYKLVGAMYTDRVSATEDELNDRIPLSIARWHQHINFCKAPRSEKNEYLGPDARFGLRGSITTEAACDAADGIFYPHVFGWMVHIYPYEKDPKKIWSIDNDHEHDNMEHSAMPGMPIQ
jgi:hypothetical protein